MRLRKVCPRCNTVVHVKRSVCDCCHAFASKKRKARCTTVGEPENAMKRRRASETREQDLYRKEQNWTHLACAECSAFQCCSFMMLSYIPDYLQDSHCNTIRLLKQKERVSCIYWIYTWRIVLTRALDLMVELCFSNMMILGTFLVRCT